MDEPKDHAYIHRQQIIANHDTTKTMFVWICHVSPNYKKHQYTKSKSLMFKAIINPLSGAFDLI